jgi:hypothetical protein
MAAMLRIWLVPCLILISTTFGEGAEPSPTPTPNHIISRIPRQPIESSAIAKIGYSKRRHILEIEFVNGAIYRYLDVPPSVYRELKLADSKARFYDANIRRHYHSVMIRARHKETD